MASSSHEPAVREEVQLGAAGEAVLPEAAGAAAAREATLSESDAGQAASLEDLQLDMLDGRQIVDDASQRDTGGDNVHTGNRFSCPSLTPMSARYVYAGIFLFANIIAWVLRENPITYFWGQRLSGCQGRRDCLAAEGVLITSQTFFLFYSVMFLSTVGTRTVHDRRNSWQFEWWLLKIILWLICLVISVFTPSGWIQLYGKAARIGAGAFLLIALISVIRFITRLNYTWCQQTNFENHYHKVITVSVLAYGGSIAGIIFMFIRYTGCLVNVILIRITLGLVCLMVLISLLSKSRGFYMEPGLMGAYIVFLCWSAIQSEPDTRCFKKGKAGSGDDNWKTIISFIAELVGITYTTYSTGSDSIRLRNNVVRTTENDVPYGYGFFHLVFASGSMYFGMLFVGWDTHHTSDKWSMDVGRTSTWVHFATMVLAFISFVAVVIARRYEIGWLQQLLGKISGIDSQQQENNNDDAHHTELEGSTADIVPTGPERSEMDNGSPPPESHSTEHERSEMDDDNGPPPASSSSTLADLLRIPQSPLSNLVESDSDEIVEYK